MIRQTVTDFMIHGSQGNMDLAEPSTATAATDREWPAERSGRLGSYFYSAGSHSNFQGLRFEGAAPLKGDVTHQVSR